MVAHLRNISLAQQRVRKSKRERGGRERNIEKEGGKRGGRGEGERGLRARAREERGERERERKRERAGD